MGNWFLYITYVVSIHFNWQGLSHCECIVKADNKKNYDKR